MRLAYLVSRFPVATETFIVRELNAVEGPPGAEITLHSLFAPEHPFVHPAAERWMGRHRRPSALDAARGVAWAALSRPRRLLGVVATVLREYGRSPRRLVRMLATLPAATALARVFERERVDHVHAHWATYPALAAWTCRQLVGVSYSLTPHAHDIFVDQSGLRRLVGDAAFVVAITDYNRGFLRPYAGTTPLPVVRVGIDLERFAFRPRRPPASGPVRALCVASFSEYKGHRVLLDALAVGGEALERIELDLVGRGALRGEVEAQAARLGLTPRIRFHGTLAEDQVAELQAAADLFVLPSVVARNGDTEGLPVVLLEALASGTPAVATAVAGCPEVLREEATCLLAMPGDPASLAAALEHVVTHPEAAERRAAAGRRLVERDYTVARVGEAMAALLRDASRR